MKTTEIYFIYSAATAVGCEPVRPRGSNRFSGLGEPSGRVRRAFSKRRNANRTSFWNAGGNKKTCTYKRNTRTRPGSFVRLQKKKNRTRVLQGGSAVGRLTHGRPSREPKAKCQRKNNVDCGVLLALCRRTELATAYLTRAAWGRRRRRSRAMAKRRKTIFCSLSGVKLFGETITGGQTTIDNLFNNHAERYTRVKRAPEQLPDRRPQGQARPRSYPNESEDPGFRGGNRVFGRLYYYCRRHRGFVRSSYARKFRNRFRANVKRVRRFRNKKTKDTKRDEPPLPSSHRRRRRTSAAGHDRCAGTTRSVWTAVGGVAVGDGREAESVRSGPEQNMRTNPTDNRATKRKLEHNYEKKKRRNKIATRIVATTDCCSPAAAPAAAIAPAAELGIVITGGRIGENRLVGRRLVRHGRLAARFATDLHSFHQIFSCWYYLIILNCKNHALHTLKFVYVLSLNTCVQYIFNFF